MTDQTSWGADAEWYDELVSDEQGYQKQLILPHLNRLLALTVDDRVLDIGCGSGLFSHACALKAKQVVGVDIAGELLTLARKQAQANETFIAASADNIPHGDTSFTKAISVLALQNMQNLDGVLRECARLLKARGTFHIVLNHPCFRVPQASSWGWAEEIKTQYRRIDRYLSETRATITMHPGGRGAVTTTLSYHRPLQLFFKLLHKNGFVVSSLEEWTSHKKSERGPRAKAENNARKEIPLFMYLAATKI